MDLGQTIAILLGVFLVIWYVFASAYNRRLGIRTYRWIQSGAKTFGKITEARWFGSSGSGGRMVVAKPGAPFRRVEIAFLLETRELLPLWLLNHARGRRDYMILKANVRNPPRSDVEILPQGDNRFRTMENPPGAEIWTMADVALPNGFAAAQRGRDTAQLLERASPLLASDGPSIRRLSLARTSPHLIAEINLPLLMTSDAPEFFTRLANIVASKSDYIDKSDKEQPEA